MTEKHPNTGHNVPQTQPEINLSGFPLKIQEQILLKAYSRNLVRLHRQILDAVEQERYEDAAGAKKEIDGTIKEFIQILQEKTNTTKYLFYQSGHTEAKLAELNIRTEKIARNLKQQASEKELNKLDQDNPDA